MSKGDIVQYCTYDTCLLDVCLLAVWFTKGVLSVTAVLYVTYAYGYYFITAFCKRSSKDIMKHSKESLLKQYVYLYVQWLINTR